MSVTDTHKREHSQSLTPEQREDRMLVGDWAVEGTWFYDSYTGDFYQITSVSRDKTRLTLEKGITVSNEGATVGIQNKEEEHEEHWVTTITELSGAIEAGDLFGISKDTTRACGDISLTNVGQYLLISTAEDIDSIAKLSLETPSPQPRHTDLSAHSLSHRGENSIPKGYTTQFVLTVNGSESIGLSLLENSKNQTVEEQTGELSTRQKVVTDGSHAITTVGSSQRVDSIAYYPSEDPKIISRYVNTSEHPSATFEEPNLRRFVLTYMKGRVLNACAGPTSLADYYTDGQIIRNDINPTIEADLHVDVAKLASNFEENSFDTIIYDPPWSNYQSNMRYDGYMVHKKAPEGARKREISIDVRELPFTVPGERAVNTKEDGGRQLMLGEIDETNNRKTEEYSIEYGNTEESKSQIGHARLAKLGFDYLLKEGGHVIQLAYTGTILPASLNYEQIVRVSFDPIGEAKTLVGGVDRKC